MAQIVKEMVQQNIYSAHAHAASVGYPLVACMAKIPLKPDTKPLGCGLPAFRIQPECGGKIL